MAGRFTFSSSGALIGDRLRRFLVEQESKKRQDMLDQLLVNTRMREQARADMEMQRDAERTRVADERYTQERSDRLMAQADVRGERYQQEELRRQEREEANTQRNLDRADAAATRYQDAELDRQRDEAQRASNERVARINASGRGKDSSTSTASDHDPSGILLDSVDELSTRINNADGLLAKAQGMWSSAAAKANYDDDVAEYQALIDGAIPIIARKMGHTGVLTQQDVDSVRAMFPKPGDGKGLRDRKIANVRRLMNKPSGKTGNTGSGNGRRIGRFEVIE